MTLYRHMSSEAVVAFAGGSYRTLDYWCRTTRGAPEGHGSGTQREWTWTQVLAYLVFVKAKALMAGGYGRGGNERDWLPRSAAEVIIESGENVPEVLVSLDGAGWEREELHVVPYYLRERAVTVLLALPVGIWRDRLIALMRKGGVPDLPEPRSPAEVPRGNLAIPRV